MSPFIMPSDGPLTIIPAVRSANIVEFFFVESFGSPLEFGHRRLPVLGWGWAPDGELLIPISCDMCPGFWCIEFHDAAVWVFPGMARLDTFEAAEAYAPAEITETQNRRAAQAASEPS